MAYKLGNRILTMGDKLFYASGTFSPPKIPFLLYFSGYTDGVTEDTTGYYQWTSGGVTEDADTWWKVVSGKMTGRDMDKQGYIETETIDISTYSDLTAQVYLSTSSGMESTDYIRVYYVLDGGNETYFTTNGNNTGNITTPRTASQTGLNGNTLKIVIRVLNNANNEYSYIWWINIFEA